MTTREEVLEYCLSFPDTYQDAPFHDDNWQLVRIRNSKKTFALEHNYPGGTIPEDDVERMIAESYDIVKGKKK